jgi:uncharacterized membrane protein YfcA
MQFLDAIHPLYSVSGFAVGLLVGLTGVGGGSLMTPLLVLVFGISPPTAVGTDLLYAAATKSAGTLVHGISKTVDWRVVGRLASGSIPATIVTLVLLAQLDLHGKPAAQLMSTVLGFMLFLTAGSLIFRRQLLELYAGRVGELSSRRTAFLTVTTGAILGVLVSLSSVGAGAVGVTALVLLYPKLPTARIVGSDIAHAVPLTLVAGLGHWLLGSVDWLLLTSLLVGSVPGIMLGSYLAARVPDLVLRPLLASALVLVGSKLAF